MDSSVLRLRVRILLAALVVSMLTNIAAAYMLDQKRKALAEAESDLAIFVTSCLNGIPMRVNEQSTLLCRARLINMEVR